MSKKFLTNLDLNKNELQNAVVQPLGTPPQNPKIGQIYFDTNNNSNTFYICVDDGSHPGPDVVWDTWGTGSGSVTSIATSAPITGGTITSSGTIGHSTAAGYKHVPSGGSTNNYLKYGGSSGTASWQAPDTTPTVDSGNLITSGAVASAISGLGTPMQFKGTLGTGGTITSLPTASSSNAGYSYKVITDGTYASQAAKAGDMFVSDGSSWILIPSGDDPSGTVTNIATSGAITGGPITTTGTISHSTSAGYKHIPTSGSTNQYLKYGGSSGTAAWQSPDTAPASGSNNLITSGAVYTAVNGISPAEQISRASFTIASGSSTGSVSIGTGKTIYAVTTIQSNAGVVADWAYSSGSVTVTLSANAASAVTVNVLYYGGGTTPSSVQADFVVAQGTLTGTAESSSYPSGTFTGNYQKWDSGMTRVWGRFNTTTTTNDFHLYSIVFDNTSPVLFKSGEKPVPTVSARVTDDAFSYVGQVDAGPTATDTTKAWVAAYIISDKHSKTADLFIEISGHWK